jgi:hypothetical protein
MRKRILHILFITILILVSLSCRNHKSKSADTLQPRPSTIEEIEYIIVKNAFFNETKILKPNAALLITNKDEIIEAQELFLAEKEYAHTCGYDYSIQFWKDYDTLYHGVNLNSECEIFSYKPTEAQKRLNYYKRKLETEPTHFIYNLVLSILTTPDEIKSSFKNSGLKLFFIDGNSTRFPKIYFSYRHNTFVGKGASDKDWGKAESENKAKTIDKINVMIDKFIHDTNLLEQSEIFFYSYGRAGDYMTHRGSVTLEFEIGTDLQKAIDILTKEGAEINNKEIPENYYIQLIDTSSNIDYIKHKLMKYKIVKDVFDYNE